MTMYDPFKTIRTFEKMTPPTFDVAMALQSFPQAAFVDYNRHLTELMESFTRLTSLAKETSQHATLAMQDNLCSCIEEYFDNISFDTSPSQLASARLNYGSSVQLVESLNSRFQELAAQILETAPDDGSFIDSGEFSEKVAAAQTVVEKKQFSIQNICALISLFIEIFMLAQSFLPNAQLSELDSKLNETMEIYQEVEEGQEQQIDIQLHLLEEARKQTEALKELANSTESAIE